MWVGLGLGGGHLWKHDEHFQHDRNRYVRGLSVQLGGEPLHDSGGRSPPLGTRNMRHQRSKGQTELDPHQGSLCRMTKHELHYRITQATDRPLRELFEIALHLRVENLSPACKTSGFSF
jgi:hypothetical protein